MRLGIISDLHYGIDQGLDIQKEKAIKSMLKGLDALILCDDNAELEQEFYYHKTLFSSLRKMTRVPIAFVVGNHDLFGHVLRRGISHGELKGKFDRFSALADEYGLVHLEAGSLAMDDFTIIGTYGHYDGTLSGMVFKEDAKTVQRSVQNLESRAMIQGRKILITHTVPAKSLIGHEDGPLQDQYTPYAGSLRLRDAIKKIKPDWHFCGHTHAYAQATISNTKCYNVGTDYMDFHYLILDTVDASVVRLGVPLRGVWAI